LHGAQPEFMGLPKAGALGLQSDNRANLVLHVYFLPSRRACAFTRKKKDDGAE
jgi:hypothetical protein